MGRYLDIQYVINNNGDNHTYPTPNKYVRCRGSTLHHICINIRVSEYNTYEIMKKHYGCESYVLRPCSQGTNTILRKSGKLRVVLLYYISYPGDLNYNR